MGYFDALSSASFKTSHDGRRLFFPWGVLGRGYVIEYEQDAKRIEQEIKIFMNVALILIIGFGEVGSYLQSFVVAALLTGVYTVRAWYLIRRLQRSDERLSLKESTASPGPRAWCAEPLVAGNRLACDARRRHLDVARRPGKEARGVRRHCSVRHWRRPICDPAVAALSSAGR